MSIELVVLIIGVLLLTVIVIVSRSSEQKKQGYSQVRAFLDHQMKDITSKIGEKKDEVEKLLSSLELMTNRSTAISKVVEDNLKKTDARLESIENNEEKVELLKNKLLEVEYLTEEVLSKQTTIKKEMKNIEDFKQDFDELDIEYRELSRVLTKDYQNKIEQFQEQYEHAHNRVQDLEIQMESDVENKMNVLETKINSGLQQFEDNINLNIEELSNKKEQDFHRFLEQINSRFDNWLKDQNDNIDPLLENMEHKIQQINLFKESFEHNILDFKNRIEDEILLHIQQGKDALDSFENKFSILEKESKQLVYEQAKKSEEVNTHIQETFQTSIKDIRNEVGTLTSNYKDNLIMLEDQMVEIQEQFKKEYEILTKDVSRQIFGFTNSLEKVDVLAEEQDRKIKIFFEERKERVEEEIKNQLDAVHEMLQNTEINVKKILQNFNTQIGTEMDVLFKDVDVFKGKILTDYTTLDEKLDQLHSQLDKKSDQEIEKAKLKYDTGYKEIEEKLFELHGELNRIVQGVQQKAQLDFKKIFDEIIYEKEELLSQQNKVMHSLESNVENYVDSAASKLGNLESDILGMQELLNKTKEQASHDLNFKIKELDAIVVAQQHKMNEKMLNLEKKSQETFFSLEKEFRDVVDNTTISLKKDKDIFLTDLNHLTTKVEDMNHYVEGNINNQRDKIFNLFKKEKENMQEELLKFQDEVYFLLEERKLELKKKLDHFDRELNQHKNEHLMHLDEILSENKQYSTKLKEDFEYQVLKPQQVILKKNFDDLQTKQSELLNEYEDFLTDSRNKKNHLQEEFETSWLIPARDSMQQYFKELIDYRNDLQQKQDDVLENVVNYEKHLKTILEEDLIKPQKTKLEELFNKIKEETEFQVKDNRFHIDEKLKEMTDQVNLWVLQNQDKVRELVDKQTETFQGARLDLQDRFDQVMKQEKSKIENITQDLSEMKFNIDNELKKQKNLVNIALENVKGKLENELSNFQMSIEEKEKNVVQRLENRAEILSRKILEFEDKVGNFDAYLYQEIGKNSKDIKDDLVQLQQEFKSQTKTIFHDMYHQRDILAEDVEKVKQYTQEIEKNVHHEVNQRMAQIEREFTTSLKIFEKDILNKKDSIESQIGERYKVLNHDLESIKEDIEKLEEHYNRFKSEKKVTKVFDELGNLDSTLKRIERQKESVVDSEKNFEKIRKETAGLLQEIGKFEAKKAEVEQINNRVNQAILRSQEMDERIENLNNKSSYIQSIESKIQNLEELYNKVQNKSEEISRKEKNISEIANNIEVSGRNVEVVEVEIKKLRNEIEKEYKKVELIQERTQQLNLQLQEVREGEEKIETILGRFEEMEAFNADIQAKLKQLAGANERLDIAEARIKNLLATLDSSEVVDQAVKKVHRYNKEKANSIQNSPISHQEISSQQDVQGQESISLPRSKVEAILKYKNNGFTNAVIANILELSVEEIENVLKS